MTINFNWLRESIPNPANLSPHCSLCSEPGGCLIPFEIDQERRAVVATFRCENGHLWTQEFLPEPEPQCAC